MMRPRESQRGNLAIPLVYCSSCWFIINSLYSLEEDAPILQGQKISVVCVGQLTFGKKAIADWTMINKKSKHGDAYLCSANSASFTLFLPFRARIGHVALCVRTSELKCCLCVVFCLSRWTQTATLNVNQQVIGIPCIGGIPNTFFCTQREMAVWPGQHVTTYNKF